MLTVRDSKQDMLAGLAAGADDYVVKGASVDEILARLEVGRRITHVDRSQRASNRENQRLLLTDPLTGAYNLRYFVQQLPRELGRSLRYGRPMAILSCAIEGFKPVNDGFGRETGDDLLRAFASRTESCIRKSSDWLARVGDNDFIVVLPETTASAASRVAQKLRQVFTSKPVITRAGPINFTASIGVTAAEVKDELDGGLHRRHLKGGGPRVICR
jgi:two-component system cell cycle response regulator